MKKQLLIYVIVLISFWNCENNLEFEPKSVLTEDTYFENEQDAMAAVTGIYDVLGFSNQYSSSIWLLQDLASDDCYINPKVNDPNLIQLSNFDIQTTNIYLTGIYQESYAGIHRANVALLNIPAINMDEDLKNRLLAEAHFLRGVFYFNLVRLFGDIPMVTEPSNDLGDYQVSRTSSNTIYQEIIIPDFTQAVEYLPVNFSSVSDKGRATKGAALGMLAKVYLTLNEYNLAAKTARKVINLNAYSLWDNFADIFKVANKNGKESVFEIQFYDGDPNESCRIVLSGLPSSFAFPAGVEIMLPTDNLLNLFEEGDHRKQITFFDSIQYFGPQTFDPHIRKFWDDEVYPVGNTTKATNNFPVIRYAEILLIYAEALNEVNNGPTDSAYYAINLVRERARNGITDIIPDISDLNQDDFRTAVLKEKRCETVNEGHRWYDLVRTGNLLGAVENAKEGSASPENYNDLFPIPQREIDLNKKLVQNTGYF